MKTRNLLLTLGAAAFAAITINATASDALLSPRAAGNQIQHVSGTANDVNLATASILPADSLFQSRPAGSTYPAGACRFLRGFQFAGVRQIQPGGAMKRHPNRK